MKKIILFFKKYLLLVLILCTGLVGTIFCSKNIFNNDILFTLSSGIFGSAFIALSLEILNDLRKQKDILKQRKVVFRDIKIIILNLLRVEFNNLLFYNNEYIKLINNEKKYKLFKAIDEIKNLIKNIEKYNKQLFQTSIIDDNWLIIYQHKNSLLFDKTLLNLYEKLSKNIQSIIDNKIFYINNKIIDDKEITLFENILFTIEYIIKFTIAQSKENIFEPKANFLDQIKQISNILEIDNKIIKIY